MLNLSDINLKFSDVAIRVNYSLINTVLYMNLYEMYRRYNAIKKF